MARLHEMLSTAFDYAVSLGLMRSSPTIEAKPRPQ